MIAYGDELHEHLRDGPLWPVYLVTSAQPQGRPARNQEPPVADAGELIAARRLIENAALRGSDRKVDHAIVDYVDENAEGGAHQVIAHEARSTSLFGGVRVVSVTHADTLAFDKPAKRGRGKNAAPAKVDPLERLLGSLPERPPSPVVLIFQAVRFDRRVRAFKMLAERGAIVSVEPPSPHRLARYIDRTADRHKITVQSGVAQRLWDHLGGGDPGRLRQTADRLLLDAGPGGKLTVAQVEDLVPWDREAQVWAITDAIAGADVGAAFSVAHLLVEHGEVPLMIVSTLAGHYRRLMQVDAALLDGARTPDDVAARNGMHPFVARKSVEQLRRMRAGALATAVATLAQADLALKRTAIGDRKNAERRWLEQLVLALIRGRPLRLGGPSTSASAALGRRSAAG